MGYSKVNFLRRSGENRIMLTYIGQMGYVIDGLGLRIVIDPYLSYSVDRECSDERAEWHRLYPPPIKPEKLGGVDFVFLTHDHLDHTDPETLAAIAAASPAAMFAASAAFSDKLPSYGIPASRVISLDSDKTIALSDDVAVTPIPAAHEKLHPTDRGGFAELGFVFDFGGRKIYHAGDTCVYPGLARRIEGALAAIMPVNGRDSERAEIGVVGNMNIAEAAKLSGTAGIKLLLPAHWDLYENNGETRENIVSAMAEHPNQRYRLPSPGETIIL